MRSCGAAWQRRKGSYVDNVTDIETQTLQLRRVGKNPVHASYSRTDPAATEPQQRLGQMVATGGIKRLAQDQTERRNGRRSA